MVPFPLHSVGKKVKVMLELYMASALLHKHAQGYVFSTTLYGDFYDFLLTLLH